MSIPGLPALPGAIAGIFSEVVLLTSDLLSGLDSAFPQWGIFDQGGNAVVIADTVLSVEYRQDFKITTAPVEQGSFASYNKVQIPFDIKIRFAAGGSAANRQEFLTSIQDIIGDTNLYDVVTPDAIYTNVNLTHQDYARSASRGLGLIVVDVWMEEVRPANVATSAAAAQTGNTPSTNPDASASFDDRFSAIGTPQSPAASPTANDGTVQPQTPTSAQTSFVNNYNFAVQ